LAIALDAAEFRASRRGLGSGGGRKKKRESPFLRLGIGAGDPGRCAWNSFSGLLGKIVRNLGHGAGGRRAVLRKKKRGRRVIAAIKNNEHGAMTKMCCHDDVSVGQRVAVCQVGGRLLWRARNLTGPAEEAKTQGSGRRPDAPHETARSGREGREGDFRIAGSPPRGRFGLFECWRAERCQSLSIFFLVRNFMFINSWRGNRKK